MEKAQAYIRIQELKEILTEANRKYYVENAPTLSDYEFDMLLKELEALEREYPEYITPDSPTQTVGSDLFQPAVIATAETGPSTSEKEPAAKAKRGKAEKPKNV
jgi:DNA ligase (NAD+)